jgi:murein DD-endopeptidase MepM/ murein hydrolase activator NlpD
MPSNPRRYSLALTDRVSGVAREFTFSRRHLLVGVSLFAIVPLLFATGAFWGAQVRISELQATNARLQVENDSYRAATGELVNQVSSLQAAVDELGVRAIVDPDADRAIGRLPAKVRERAMGGAPESVAGPIFSGAFGAPDDTFGVVRDLLGIIEHRLASVRIGVERRQALASATPSMWPIAGWISSGFGTRRDPFTGLEDFHAGLDISGRTGQPIVAPADGTVTVASYNGTYGNFVTIDHGFDLTTRYGHLSRFAVGPGQQVRRGDVIGYVGSTGRSTSPHLHYEVLVNGQLTNPLRLLSR